MSADHVLFAFERSQRIGWHTSGNSHARIDSAMGNTVSQRNVSHFVHGDAPHPAGVGVGRIGALLEERDAAVSDAQQEELARLLVDDIRFYRAAVEIYDQRAASLPFSLKDRTAAFCAAKEQYLTARRAGTPHRWRAAYG